MLGNITLVMGGKLFDLMPEAYLMNGVDLNPQYMDTCIFGVMPLPKVVNGIDMFLLGDVFLRNFFSVYDFDKQELSLAINKHSAKYAGIRDTTDLGNPIIFYITCVMFISATSGVIYKVFVDQMTARMKARIELMEYINPD